MLPKFLASLLLLVALVVATPQSTPAVTHDVSMTALNTFTPANLVINVGDEVRWTNNSAVIHTSTSGSLCAFDGNWNSGNMFPGDQFTIAFGAAGVLPYYCIPHCLLNMVGTITVQVQLACAVNCPQGDADGIVGLSNKTPDLDGDGQVGLVDVTLFAQGFTPNPYEVCTDYDCDGLNSLIDLTVFAAHLSHVGAQLGVCN